MIEVKSLRRVVDSGPALAVDELRVGKGEAVGVVGAPADGRDALLDVLIGRVRPGSGQVVVAGLVPWKDRDELCRRIGVLFAQDALYERFSARQNLDFVRRLYGLPSGRVEETLRRVGLMDQADVPVQKLPPPFRRRIAFGRSIIHNPQVLLLEEPFAGADVESARLLSALILQEAERGAAVLILTEDLMELKRICKVVHFLEKGRIVESYSPQEGQEGATPFRIPARMEGRIVLLSPGEILYAYHRAGRTYLHTERGEFPTRFTLEELERLLRASGFFRAHRGYLVNLQRVREIIPYTRNSFSLVLNDSDGTEIPLSKLAARELQRLLGY